MSIVSVMPSISSSVAPFPFCPQSFPTSGSFPMNQLFTSGDGGHHFRSILFSSHLFPCVWSHLAHWFHLEMHTSYFQELHAVSSVAVFSLCSACFPVVMLNLLPYLKHFVFCSLAWSSSQFCLPSLWFFFFLTILRFFSSSFWEHVLLLWFVSLLQPVLIWRVHVFS